MSGATLPPINAYVDARKVLHGDSTTQGTICHNCYSMEIIRAHSVLKPKRYWCESLHREINPHDVRCPLEDRRRREKSSGKRQNNDAVFSKKK